MCRLTTINSAVFGRNISKRFFAFFIDQINFKVFGNFFLKNLKNAKVNIRNDKGMCTGNEYYCRYVGKNSTELIDVHLQKLKYNAILFIYKMSCSFATYPSCLIIFQTIGLITVFFIFPIHQELQDVSGIQVTLCHLHELLWKRRHTVCQSEKER